MEKLSILIACLSFAISAITLWLTYLHRGIVKMTQPTMVFFGNDNPHKVSPKVYLRTLLYSTSKRGRVIENVNLGLIKQNLLQVYLMINFICLIAVALILYLLSIKKVC